MYLPEYNLLDNTKNSLIPQILSFQVDSLENSVNLVLTKDNSSRFLLYKTGNNRNTVIGFFPDNNPIEIKSTDFKLSVYWPDAQKGSKLFFTIFNNVTAYTQLSNDVNVSQKEETNLLQISVKNKNPELAQLIAKTLIDQFKETRTEQQRLLIHESYASIDTQLNETSQK